jgi:hypothetical protein
MGPSFSGWDLAECGWDLAKCGWDLAERGWDLVECGWDLAEWLKRLTANADVSTALGSIPVSSETSGIWEAADETVLNKVHLKKNLFIQILPRSRGNDGGLPSLDRSGESFGIIHQLKMDHGITIQKFTLLKSSSIWFSVAPLSCPQMHVFIYCSVTQREQVVLEISIKTLAFVVCI